MENKIPIVGYLGLAALLVALVSACGPASNNVNQANTGTTHANQANTGGTSADANKALADCDDEKINRAILEKVKDESLDYSKIRRQINWHSKNCKVELIGWMELKGQSFDQTTKRFDAFRNLVFSIDGVKDLEPDAKEGLKLYKRDLRDRNKLKPDPKLASRYVCDGDYIRCGDICVPPGTCNNDCGAPDYCGGL